MDTAQLINGRKWVTTDKPPESFRHTFRIATYNVLTDLCIRPGQYLFCPEEIRFMSSRHEHIMTEVTEMSPDIVCFQEVDYQHFINRLQPSMKSLGYDGILHQRLDDQGLATFWKVNMFELVDQKHTILHHAAETYLQMMSLNPTQLSAVRESIRRPEAVLCVRLRHITTDKLIAIANIHVTWSRLRYPALQALQMAMAVKELDEFASRDGTCNAQIILGDFNSPPDSIPYQLIDRGVINNTFLHNDSEQLDLEQLRTFGLFKILPGAAFTVRPLFKSAYKTVLGSEPAATNCDDCGGLDDVIVHHLCLDYIWFSERSLQVVGVLETPSIEAITEHYALPSVKHPSDHIPIMAEILLI